MLPGWRKEKLEDLRRVRGPDDLVFEARQFDPASDVLALIREICGAENSEKLAMMTPDLASLGVHVVGPKLRQADAWYTTKEGETYVREDVFVPEGTRELCRLMAAYEEEQDGEA